INSINELFAVASVGADNGDLPATSAAEVQTVIDQGASRLHAITKIANYAQDNGEDTTTYPAPDAADFAAAGVTGVANDNNLAGLLAILRGTTPATNFAAADTAAELQAYVKQVAINKIAKWADTDGGTVADGTGVNAVEPILQDYLNAGLVGPFEAPATTGEAINQAMVPSLNELFAASDVATDAADTAADQQAIINAAKDQLEAMARIADYAEADGVVDFDNDGVNDTLTVADFEAIGVFGVGDGTGVSTGSGIDTSNTSYNNLTAVLNKLADAGITYVSADTAAEVQDLVAQVAVEKIARYADEDGQLPLVSETIDVTTYDDGTGNAFYLDGEQAPALTLQPGTYTFTQTEASNTGHALAFFLNSDRTGDVTSQGITVSSTGVAGSNGVTTLVIPEGFDGTLYYECANHSGMGNAVDVAVPYFEPELQDYTNAGLQDPNDNAINANQVAAINEAFADSDVGNASNEGDTYTADDVAGQQAVIDAFGDRILALEKFADYMLGTVPANDTDVLTAADFAVADFTDAGLARVDGTNMSAVLARLDDYQSSDSLTRDDLLTTANIQSYVSRAIIAEYNATSGTSQAPVAQDYIDADITGADADNVLAMNYQVKTAATFSDTVAYLDTTLVPAADATLNKLDVFDLSHVAPVSTSTRLSVSDTTAAVTLTTADFGTFADANGDSLATVKITAVPASGRLLLADAATLTVTQTTAGADAAGGSAAVAEVQTIDASSLTAHAVYELQIGADTVSVTVDGDPTAAELAALLESALNAASIPVTAAVSSNDITLTWDTAGVVSDAVTFARQAVVVQVDESITAADIAAGKLQLAPVDAATPLKTTSIGFEVSDGTNTSANNYTLAVDVSEVVNNGGFADSLVTQADEDTWTNLYDINALSDFVVPSAGIDTLRVVVEATNGHVRLGSVPTGVTEITTGFAADATAATNTAIAFEGSQDAVNAALRQLQGNLGTNPDMTLNINVQPGGVV
uniref:hypothetical protein n=1 Tax=Roseobacter sp. HKCCA2468 TaxID=3120342 RepID=UPI0030EF932D